MSEEVNQNRAKTADEQGVPWAAFLEEYPVGTLQTVSNYSIRAENATKIRVPVLRLYCDECDGTRNFAGDADYGQYAKPSLSESILVYRCRDCKTGLRRYYVASRVIDFGPTGEAVKVGEYPDVTIRTPSNLPGLLGTDYSYFVKGLKCEKNSLGVGAYSYYRRVVENQKTRMLQEILKVAQKLGAKKETTDAIQSAINETQFDKAMNMVKDVLPESLLVDGHNPFKLIHKALSIGIHNETDEVCLRLAHNVRMVLTDLAERIKAALSEQREVKDSVSSLLKFNREHT